MKKIILAVALLATNMITSAVACETHDCQECRANFKSTKAGSGKWKDPAVPKDAWVCQEGKDLGMPSLQCGMCERETIRYAHKMSHGDFGQCLSVGCICAGHMEGDIAAAKEREKGLRNRTSRRDKWLARSWKKARKTGNPYLNTPKRGANVSHLIHIFSGKFGGFSFMIDRVLRKENGWYRTQNEAKLAAFDALYPAVVTLT